MITPRWLRRMSRPSGEKPWRPYSRRAVVARWFMPSVTVRLRLDHDLTLALNTRTHLGLLRPSARAREVATASTLAALTPATGMLYDVGANIGLYTLVFAANRRREVVSFEPSPLVLPLLLANLAENRLDRVRVVAMALSDRSGSVRFALDRVTTNTSHVAHGSEPGLAVAATDLDSWLAAHSTRPPDLIKLDVEGHDGPILRGMAGVLRQHHPIVCLEGGLRRADGQIPGLAFLVELGYRLWDVSRARRLDPWTTEYVVLGLP